MGLVFLEEEEETTKLCMYRGKAIWDTWRWVCGTLFSYAQPPELEEIDCVKPPSSGNVLWQPEQTKTLDMLRIIELYLDNMA